MKLEPMVLTVCQAAEVLQISRQHAYRLIRAGELPTITVGKELRVGPKPLPLPKAQQTWYKVVAHPNRRDSADDSRVQPDAAHHD